MIKINHLTKKFGDFAAVNDLNFDIPKGSIFGFVGKNGAGKSTTIRCMMNMLSPTKGTITIKHLDSITDSKAIKSIVSYMPSDITYYDNLTVKEFLIFTLKFSSKTITDAQELAHYFELDMSKKIAELSLGNKKKVSITSMFLRDSEIIILDEPTNGLDPLMQRKFFERIIKERDAGKTIFLSSHNLMEIEKYCDQVAIIKDGKLIDLLEMDKVSINHPQTVTYQIEGKDTITEDVTEDINTLVARLSLMKLTHLEIKRKSVEDEFIGYYEDTEEVDHE